MDLEEFLCSNFLNKNSRVLNKLVNSYVISIKYQNELVDALLNIYNDKLISNNVWVIKELYNKLEIIKSNKNYKESKSIILNIMSLFMSLPNDIDNTIGQINDDLNDSTKDKITKLSYTFNKEYQVLSEYKEYILGNVYALLNVIYSSLYHQKSFEDLVLIIKYILKLKKPQIFFTRESQQNLNIIDILFDILLDIPGSNDIKQFIELNRLVYSFNKKLNRYNLLYISIYACINRNIKDQIIDYKSLDREVKMDTTTFLFTLYNYDYEILLKLEREKALLQNVRPIRKIINIENCNLIEENKKMIEIIKTS